MSKVAFKPYHPNQSYLIPPSWDEKILDFTVNGCHYQAEICYKCNTDPTHYQMDQHIDWIVPLPNQGNECQILIWHDLYDEVEAAIYQQLTSYGWYLGLCGPKILPPCDPGPGYPFSIYDPVCKKKIWMGSLPALIPCSDERDCRSDYTICWDPIDGPIITYISSIEIGTEPVCDEIYYCVPDPPVGGESECFHLDSKCSYP